MSKELIPNSEIQKAKDNEKYIFQTAEQIQKDFGMFGMDINFEYEVHLLYEDLMKQMTVHLNQLIDNQSERIHSLLYQIDISEKQIRKQLEYRDEMDYAMLLSEMIIEREMKKVLLRNYFKENL